MNKNYGTIVSRVLDNTDKNFLNVIFQQQRPPLDSEWNLVQDLSQDRISEVLRKTTPSGFLELDDLQGAPENRNELSSSWPNALILKNPKAIVNGWVIHVGGGTNQFQEGALESAWKSLSNSEDEVVVLGTDSPYIGYREDLVFMEVWIKLVETSDPIYKYGFIQSSLDLLQNDLIDENIEIETSKRIQVQYRFRWVEGVDFSSYRRGLGWNGCYAQGPLVEENTSYYYRPHDTDPGLFVTGDGGDTSKQDLGTVDGFIYAIPIARVHRRNKEAYSLSNQNGALKSMLSGQLSERPDGLYYDEVSAKDLEDLRHSVSLTGFNYKDLLEENLQMLWNNTLPSELKESSLDNNLRGNEIIYADGISTGSRTGIDDTGRDPDDFLRYFSASKGTQVITKYLNDPSHTVDNKYGFIPFNLSPATGEYHLWNEDLAYVSKKEPTVLIYDDTVSPMVRQTITGGVWSGLGEFRTSSYLTSEPYNKIYYTPPTPTALTGKKVVFIFELVIREGGGVLQTNGGFTNKIHKMYTGFNEKDGRPVEFNKYDENQSDVVLEEPRTTFNYTDTAISISINRFEEASSPSSLLSEKYRAAAAELTYYQVSTGSSQETLPLELYGREIVGISSIFNVTTSAFLTATIEKQLTEYKIIGLTVDTEDIIQYTLLLGNYTVDYVPHVKGIKNICKTYKFTVPITIGDTEGIINAKSINPSCDGLLAATGFYNGFSRRHVGYINNKMYYLSDLQGLGSPVVKFTLEDPAPISGSISIYFIGYYTPIVTDKFYFQYSYIPYKGIMQNKISLEESQKLKIMEMDDKVAVISAGTGTEYQQVIPSYYGLIEQLPINKTVLPYNFFGRDIPMPYTGGYSALRRIQGRDLVPQELEEVTKLKEGQTLELELGEDEKEMFKGIIIKAPIISERALDLSVPTPLDPTFVPDPSDPEYETILDPDHDDFDSVYDPVTRYNHVTQWTGIVKGQGDLHGELFLMVITTTSLVYNEEEGEVYSYLEQKDIYKQEALGKGSETILRNNIPEAELSLNLGEKIYGAVDLFPLKYRPLILN